MPTAQEVQNLYKGTLNGATPDADSLNFWVNSGLEGANLQNAFTAAAKNDPRYMAGNNNPAGTTPMSVTAGAANPNVPGQIGAMEVASNYVSNPSSFMTKDNPFTNGTNESMFLSDQNQPINSNAFGTTIDPNDPKYQMNPNAFNIPTNVQASQVTPKTANGYEVKTSLPEVLANQMQAAQGTVSNGAIIDPNDVTMDMDAFDSSKAGEALKQAAQQNMSNIIDTSTVAGKLLAQTLGEGNYLDSKATMLGQLDIISKEFVDSNGEPKIPTWAAGTARNVSKIAAFKGMTGSAATQAMAQAIMEASLPIAQQESQFYQTLTLQNLNNRQEATINRANVLSKMELANLDNRMAAAVQNAQHFMQMDLANLSNEQQARVVNTQARIQSILEDSKQENTKRMFVAQSQNEMDMFYDQLNSQIEQFNVAQFYDASKFNATLASSREQFYKEMQYNIDISNAKWRQTITLQDDQQQFEAAAADVKNMVGISLESLNQIWDRSDALLDYVWKSSESQKDRDFNLAISKMKIDAETSLAAQARKDKTMSAVGKLVGNVFSEGLEDGFGDLVGNVFGGIF